MALSALPRTDEIQEKTGQTHFAKDAAAGWCCMRKLRFVENASRFPHYLNRAVISHRRRNFTSTKIGAEMGTPEIPNPRF
jgi:hypothetical protein